MMKAILILGPEATGTRLLTTILISAGAVGDATHFQPFDDGNISGDLIVWRRSVPHMKKWLNLQDMLESLEGYDVCAVVTVRDWWCTEKSQVRNAHVPNVETAAVNMARSYREIFGQLATFNVPFSVVVYESLVAYPHSVQRALMSDLGLDFPRRFVSVVDGNRKYWEEG